ncbi:hypothetical protein EfmJHP36_16240 [Enterococcus faecium]|nr:hypothetical protein EfmJHP36_16240 [Enterococcus faecium]
MAAEFSPKGIRVNGISAGAIKTLAVTGVKDYQKIKFLSETKESHYVISRRKKNRHYGRR